MSTTFLKRNIFAALLTDVIAAVMLVGPMLLAAAGVAALLFLAGAGHQWPWFVWVVMAPVVYLCWVVLYLVIAAFTTYQLGRRYPKPRHFVMRPGQGRSPEGLGILTAATCYRRLAIVEMLPFARATGRIRGLTNLFLRAYSPSVHIGSGVINVGILCDPDLTEVGDNAVLGGKSSIVAHTVAVREDGALVYTSAPVKIGRRATIGGEAYVALGCVIGEDAVLEQRSVAAPFTHIPPGEVWAGNPASFRRKRTASSAPDLPQPKTEPTSAASASDMAAHVSPTMSSGTPSLPTAALRELVVGALQLDPDEVPAELSSGTCAEWDSLGQVAIAAAVFDRYGIVVAGDDVFRIRTLRDLADLITSDKREPAHPEERTRGANNGTIVSAPVVAQDASSVLPDDVEMLPLVEPQEATRALAERFDREPARAQHLRVCIAASFTMQPVAPPLRVWGRAFGFDIDCYFAEYDQIVQTLLDPDGQFAANRHGMNVVLARPEDLVSNSAEDPTARIGHVLDALRSFNADPASRGQLLVGTLPPVVSAYSDVTERLAGSMREHWASALEQMPGVDIFEFGRTVEFLGIERARSSQTEVLARAPYSPQLYQALGIALIRSIRATRRAPAKVIALDCDNTLWGGVVGEIGLDGIQLGPDGPGRSFQLFQRYLKGLQARGVLLVVASRNEPSDVREVFEKHPEMILRPDDIASWRVNWEPKSQNIRELAEELRLGVDSFVFLDDDPVVQMEVKNLVPGVHVVPLPSDPSRYCETLARLWLFDAPRPTTVDASRTRMMHEESRRLEESRSIRSLDEFLAGLELQIEMGPPVEQEWARVAQLMQRTNQFNLSLKRRTLEELRSVAADRLVMVVKAQDRFGDYGLVGTCILVPPDGSGACEIDTLLISCRALGRGVEDAFLHGIAAVAAGQGASRLLTRYVEGPRNAQVRTFLTRCGFDEIERNVFSRPLDELPVLPTHVHFQERRFPEYVGVSRARRSAVLRQVERTSVSVLPQSARAAAMSAPGWPYGTPLIHASEHPVMCRLLHRQLQLTPHHEKFLSRRFSEAAPRELELCEYLAQQITAIAGDDIDAFCKAYDFICTIVQDEEYHFRLNDDYRLKSFQDAIEQVYANKPYMDSYMKGLLMTQIYWSNHTACFRFYRERFLPSLPTHYDFVEVGPGHGLLLHQAAADPRSGSVIGWDLSEASVGQTRSALCRLGVDGHVEVRIQDLFAAREHEQRFDAVVFSEVLEHLEEPDRALRHLRSLLKVGGRLFVNVPVNSPAPDHLYLLRSPEEAVGVIESAGFAIEDREFFPATNYTLEQARKRALTISVCVTARRA
jgi:FkbH-like protein